MLKALIRKQFSELLNIVTKKQKNGKKRSKLGTGGFIVLFVFLYLSLAAAFLGISHLFGSALIPAGTSGLYFSMIGMMSIFLGSFGSIFNTYSSLYHAKDNEFLLAMPVSPGKILLVRMISVYAMSFLYCSVVWLPAMIQYWILQEISVSGIVLPVLLLFFIALFVTVIASALGWVVALISAHVKNKSLVTVVLTITLLGGYYYAYFQINSLLQKMLLHSEEIGTAIRNWAWPVYQMGLGAAGSITGFAFFALISAALFAVLYWILSKTFIKIVTGGKSANKTVYVEKTVRMQGMERALLRKEFRRFLASPTYMTNAGLGVLIMPVLAIAALVKREWLLQMIGMLELAWKPGAELIPAIPVLAICMIAGMDCFTAPSVSLEGKNLWIVQSMPVDFGKLLNAKLKLHLIMNTPSAVVSAAALGLILGVKVPMLIVSVVFAAVYIGMMAEAGLILSLRFPNLKWTSEAAPVKQGMSVTISLFGGWVFTAAFGALYYFLLRDILSPLAYLLAGTALMAVGIVLMHRWVHRKGEGILEFLN